MRLGRHIVVVDRSVVRFRQHQHHGHHEVDSLDMDSLHPKWRTESPMAAEIPNQIEHENIREGKDRRFAPDSLLLAPCADDALDSKIGEDDNYSILSKYWNNALVAEEVALVAVAEEGEEEDMRVLSCPQYARNRRWSQSCILDDGRADDSYGKPPELCAVYCGFPAGHIEDDADSAAPADHGCC